MNLNQIRKEYNNSIRDIPEEKLKELLDKLYYEAYHSFFIEEDKKSYEKTITTIEGLIKNTKQPKLFNAGKEAIVRQPAEVMVELYNKNKEETQDKVASLLSVVFLIITGDLDMNNELINSIDNCSPGDERRCLEDIRNNLVKIRDTEITLLEKNRERQCNLVDYLENKTELLKHEKEIIERLKEGTG